MSLLDRVAADFEAIVLNTNDFAQSVTYTAAGSTTGAALTCCVIPEESRVESRDGFRVQVDRIHVSALSSAFAPAHGSKVVYSGRTWDFASLEHDAGGGFNGAYFESMTLLHGGAVGVSPI